MRRERPDGAEEKAWGWSQELSRQMYFNEQAGRMEVLCRTVLVHIRAGGYSSVHCHHRCSNIFSVSEGRLLLRRFTKPDKVLGEFVQEPADKPYAFDLHAPHQFVALTDVMALEIYIAGPCGHAGPEDIERFSVNGAIDLGLCPIVAVDRDTRLAVGRWIEERAKLELTR